MSSLFKQKLSPSEPETTGQRALARLRGSFGKRNNLLGLWLFLLVNVGALGIVFLLQLVLLVQSGRIANKPAAVLVETSDGTGFLVDAIPASQRTPRAIQRFTSDILSALFTVSPIVAPGQPFEEQKLHGGVRVQKQGESGNDRVSATAYVAAVAAVSPEFRDAFLNKLASITPPSAFSGDTQILFKLDFLGEPRPVGGNPGQWTITVIGARYIVEGSQGNMLTSLEPQPFRQVIYLEAVAPQFDPIPEVSTDLQKSVAAITSTGLRITKMVPVDTSTPQGGDFLEIPAEPSEQESKEETNDRQAQPDP